MARKNRLEQLKVPRGRGKLPDPFYYLNNFQTVLASIDRRYAALLSSEERQFIAHFSTLPRASRALLVRMVMRKGSLFRRSRLKYPEIGDAAAAVAPLLQAGWVDASPCLEVNKLQKLLTKAELLRYFSVSRPYRNFNKSDLVAVLRAQYPGSKPFLAWCQKSGDHVYQLAVSSLCERFRLMFFGNFHQDWTEFVLTDLGISAYERIPASLQSLAFRTHAHVESFEQIYRCHQWLDADLALDEVVAGVPPRIANCDWLEERRQKLLFQIARAYERSGNHGAALTVLSDCTHRGARLRTIRLRERAHEWSMARELCLAAQRDPEDESERQQVDRLLPRLNRKLGGSGINQTETIGIPAFDMAIDRPSNDYAVEYLVRDCLAQQSRENTHVHYVENALIVSLFGLLCWKAIFAPIPGAFFHDFQYGPADLSSGQFYERRRSEFIECFSELESDRYQWTIRQCFTAKAGIQSPFVAWGALSKRLLDWALWCFPAAHLRLWFEWIMRDIQANRAGFPDLVQFWPRDQRYRMIEVKAPGDRLQDNQRRLLEFCVSHRMPVSVCYVRWVVGGAGGP
jgi:VRR-NUC domain/Fanconi anemia-associated nuclease SAP domain